MNCGSGVPAFSPLKISYCGIPEKKEYFQTGFNISAKCFENRRRFMGTPRMAY